MARHILFMVETFRNNVTVGVVLLGNKNPESASRIQFISERMGEGQQLVGRLIRLVKRKFSVEPKQERVSSKALHVCYVSFFPPSRGRLSEYAFFFIDALQKLPDIKRIDVISDKSRPHVVSMNDKTTLHGVWKSSNVFSILSILFKILRLKPDIVHFNLHLAVFGKTRVGNFVGLSIPFLCRLMGVPCIVTLHNIIERIKIEKTGMKNTFLNRLGTFVATKLLTLSSLLTVTVRSYVDLISRRYKCSKIRWIPHGTWNVELSDPVEVGDPDNILYSVHDGKHVVFGESGKNGKYEMPKKSILYFGHHGPYKDPRLVFDAIQILNSKRDLELIVAGRSHPNYPDFLEEYRRNNNLPNVHFTGFVPKDMIPILFRKVDLLILPYHTCTGTSGVAHLAASYGVPIVATDLPELRELADEGCGIVFCSHNPVSLAEKIEYVLDNPKVAFELRKQNLHFTRGRTWDKIARVFEKCYQNVLARGSTSG